jgi:hypothetical protein
MEEQYKPFFLSKEFDEDGEGEEESPVVNRYAYRDEFDGITNEEMDELQRRSPLLNPDLVTDEEISFLKHEMLSYLSQPISMVDKSTASLVVPMDVRLLFSQMLVNTVKPGAPFVRHNFARLTTVDQRLFQWQMFGDRIEPFMAPLRLLLSNRDYLRTSCPTDDQLRQSPLNAQSRLARSFYEKEGALLARPLITTLEHHLDCTLRQVFVCYDHFLFLLEWPLEPRFRMAVAFCAVEMLWEREVFEAQLTEKEGGVMTLHRADVIEEIVPVDEMDEVVVTQPGAKISKAVLELVRKTRLSYLNYAYVSCDK